MQVTLSVFLSEASSLLFFTFTCERLLWFVFGISVGLKAADRTGSQADWMAGKVPVIVATISFGMGVDKANVRWVYLYYFPLPLQFFSFIIY